MSPPIRILVVEDHPVVRHGIIAILSQAEDMEVIAEAENGLEAINQYETHQPDITLMDLRMPHLEGVEAIARIRAKTSTAQIIILTTYDTDEDIYRGLQAGARGYILKDTTATELIQAIRTVHGGKRYIPSEVALKLADRIDDSDLTERELEVLQLLSKGNSNQEIAAALTISEGTVKFHINNILSKLGVKDRTQAVIMALKKGLARLD
ncbi:response regulator [Acaryochloris marina]|uniref:Two component transcriptional regulator, LuxR family n=1 Tax=Acaryochloris marina (strain MBIC 11017) TaxID=329726 RepID=B0C7F9_ACAM1|nr:response regulator transcription factor [Acaryochloris marina]ABW31243.1 two component transcriptional regulator, LuxR family [Acaryochloris marina MBIC11017]BDM79924.1 DNA-binding response regulator [Acaryochloris marina MBIC10699]